MPSVSRITGKAKSRLRAIKLVQRNMSISEACRLTGVPRQLYRRYESRYMQKGHEGLVDMSRARKTQSRAKPPALEKKVLGMALKDPQWSCHKISAELKSRSVSVSSFTVQAILKRNGLGQSAQRWARLEKAWQTGGTSLTKNQITCLERLNPCIRERDRIISYPGELIVQDWFELCNIPNVGMVYLEVLVDVRTSLANAIININRPNPLSGWAGIVRVDLHFKALGISLGSFTTNGLRNRVRIDINYSEDNEYLQEYRKPRGSSPGRRRPDGFTERFLLTTRKEFLPSAKKHRLSKLKFGKLIDSFEEWLKEYNSTGRFHEGYPNWGTPPTDVIDCHTKSR